jgi:uncharacterized membrane protein YidH (DUF202 family)
MTFWQILGLVVAGLVVVVLVFGLVNLMRGGPASTSQKLMRARVMLQFLAIVIVMVALYFSTRGTG